MSQSISYRSFNDQDLLLLSTDEQLSYKRRSDDQKKSIPYGQRKLFLSELYFLATFWNVQDNPNPVVIYAGAAPGNHIPFLSNLFPTMTFHLYDPRCFYIKESSRIHIYQQYFTDKEAIQWSKRNDVLFMSDIRTANYLEMTDLDNELAIINDMKLQESWYNLMAPISALLKFRLPYSDHGIDRYFTYLDGLIFKQPWTPQTSTETRLVPFAPHQQTTWDSLKYEFQMFYHNVTIREHFLYLNPLTNDISPIDYPELLNDYDSVSEAFIIINYLKKMNKPTTPSLIKTFSRLLTSHLNQPKKNDHWYTLSRLRSDPLLIKRKYKD